MIIMYARTYGHHLRKWWDIFSENVDNRYTQRFPVIITITAPAITITTVIIIVIARVIKVSAKTIIRKPCKPIRRRYRIDLCIYT